VTHPLLISIAYPELCCTLESGKRVEVGVRLFVLFITESSSKLIMFLELCKSTRGERESNLSRGGGGRG